MNNKSVLAFMAHPDDVEFLCAGTLIKLEQKGYEIHLATMTAGDGGTAELSPEEITRIRLGEAEEAARQIDGTYHCAGEKDFQVCFVPSQIQEAVEIVRQAQPAIVITHSPVDYTPDHEVTAQLVRNACFCAGAPNMKTNALPAAPPLGGIPHLYYASPLENKDSFGQPIPPGFYVDVSDVIDGKEAMLTCHASQREWLLRHHGVDEYVDSMRRRGAEAGGAIGVAYAEGYRQHLGHAYPQNNILAEALDGVVRTA